MSSNGPMNKSSAIDEPHRIIKVQASDGNSGDNVEIAYTNCKVVGNGSFGIVFSAKLIQPNDDEIAVKKVLQDKRFKVSFNYTCIYVCFLLTLCRTVNYRLCVLLIILTL